MFFKNFWVNRREILLVSWLTNTADNGDDIGFERAKAAVIAHVHAHGPFVARKILVAPAVVDGHRQAYLTKDPTQEQLEEALEDWNELTSG